MSDILDLAAGAVKERGKDYGTPFDNHGRTANMWTAYCRGRGITFSPEDVCAMMILAKVSRFANGYHKDTVVDIAGYADNLEDVHQDHVSIVKGMQQANDMAWSRSLGAIPFVGIGNTVRVSVDNDEEALAAIAEMQSMG